MSETGAGAETSTEPETVAVEASGETVGEAKWRALRELERRAPGLDKASVRFQVVAEGERGLLGVGYAPARVVATADVGAPPPPGGRSEGESALAARVRGIVERVVEATGAGADVLVEEREEEVAVSCRGGDAALLIGRRGQTIDALQHVVNAALWRSGVEKPVTVDAAGYRKRRRVSLESLAVESAERALGGETVSLEPMTAVERKVVHERLKEYEGVRTSSVGSEPNRYVVVEREAEA